MYILKMKGDDMVDIMTYLHQYVPTVKSCDNSSGSQFILSDQVQFHSTLVGDQSQRSYQTYDEWTYSCCVDLKV